MLGIAGIYRYLGRIYSCLVMLSLTTAAAILIKHAHFLHRKWPESGITRRVDRRNEAQCITTRGHTAPGARAPAASVRGI